MSSSVVLRPARPDDAREVARAWYDAFGSSHLNKWLLEGSDHAAFTRRFERDQRVDILRGVSEFLVAELPHLPFAGYCQFTRASARGGLTCPVQRTAVAKLYRRVRAWLQTCSDSLAAYWRGGDDKASHATADARYCRIGAALQSKFPSLQRQDIPVGDFIYVSWLAVRPEAQRAGVARAMLRHGMSYGLPLFLESSEAGYPVYRHLGFRDLDDPTYIYGEDGKVVDELPSMLWLPESHPIVQAEMATKDASASAGSSTATSVTA